MREIEFRGQSVNGEWHEGLLSKSQGLSGQPPKGCYISNKVGMPWAYQVIPETVSQYTGRRDRNDKKFYEYNVIELFYSVSDRHQGIIEWDMRGFWRINWNKKASVYNFRLDIFSGDNFKIIGNKFENPELLEED